MEKRRVSKAFPNSEISFVTAGNVVQVCSNGPKMNCITVRLRASLALRALYGEEPLGVFDGHLCDQGLGHVCLTKLGQEGSQNIGKAVPSETPEMLNLAHVLGEQQLVRVAAIEEFQENLESAFVQLRCFATQSVELDVGAAFENFQMVVQKET